jgi:alkanesulfonate monooxygenase
VSVTVLWDLVVHGDGRHATAAGRHRGGWRPHAAPAFPGFVRDERPGRFGAFDHLGQVADAAELAGLAGLAVPYDPDGEESWVVTGALLRRTRWSQVVVEFPASFGTPVYAAKMSATLQRLSADRLGWRLAVDVDPAVARRHGDVVEGSARYERAAEFLTVARGVWHERGFTYDGRFFHVFEGGFEAPLSGRPFPRVHLAGDTPDALALSAEHADVHLLAETPDPGAAASAGDRLRGLAAAAGRRVELGLVVPVVAREDEDEAWARVARLWREVHPGAGEHDVTRRQVGRQLWDGFDELGFGARVGLVGSYAQVAERLSAYVDAGFTTFVVRGHPQIEEAHRFGEHVLPRIGDPSALDAAGELVR